eukprot:3007557-Alexandrium_andersonii.AAC.1
MHSGVQGIGICSMLQTLAQRTALQLDSWTVPQNPLGFWRRGRRCHPGARCHATLRDDSRWRACSCARASVG